jgi:hypothetical protein
MGAPGIRAFLIHLAVEGQRAASTHHVALQALVFLYRHVLKQPFPALDDLEHAKKSHRVPVVFARQEVTKVLADIQALMCYMVFDHWERLMDCMIRGLELELPYDTS